MRRHTDVHRRRAARSAVCHDAFAGRLSDLRRLPDQNPCRRSRRAITPTRRVPLPFSHVPSLNNWQNTPRPDQPTVPVEEFFNAQSAEITTSGRARKSATLAEAPTQSMATAAVRTARHHQCQHGAMGSARQSHHTRSG